MQRQRFLKASFFCFIAFFASLPAFSNTTMTSEQQRLKSKRSLPQGQLEKRIVFDSWSVDGRRLRARGTGLGGFISFGHRLSPSVTFYGSGGFRVQTGSNNSLNLEEFAPDREWLLEEAHLSWTPLSDFIKVSIGAIDQSWIDSPLLVEDMAFMGAYQELHFGAGGAYLKLMAQQSIPNNQTLSLRAGGVDEGTPQFFIQGLSLGWKAPQLAFEVRSFYFLYDRLAGDVADKSRFMGNDVTGQSTQSAFLYDFQGWNTNVRIHIPHFLPGVSLSLLGDYLFNSKAPDSNNSGYRFGAGLGFGDFFEITGSYFELEKNASVGFYNDKRYGHNNKKGFALDFRKPDIFTKTDLTLSFTRAEVLDQSSSLDGDMDLVGMSFEYQF